jgi:hypothetical protein
MALTRRTLVLGLAATIAGGCGGEKSPVTADNAKRITRGMSEGEVMGLLGRPALQATQTLRPPSTSRARSGLSGAPRTAWKSSSRTAR